MSILNIQNCTYPLAQLMSESMSAVTTGDPEDIVRLQVRGEALRSYLNAMFEFIRMCPNCRQRIKEAIDTADKKKTGG